ncbi:MAG: PIN domain-containing protein [Propionibacteriaceae bacterium]|jgi:predicted nucleic acid-binding protein|nr:PIN domain-containing protein [Propionibacteriaceae bacterium]
MPASLDTNVLLRFAMKDVPDHYDRARALLGRQGASFAVADAVWIELAFALDRHYQLDRPAIVDVITTLVSIDNLEANSSLIEAACASFAVHPKLSFADCYLAAKAADCQRVPLYTFDEKLAHQHLAAELVPLH